MSYTRAKSLKDGTVRHYAAYLGADGRYHEEGGFKTEKEAAKKAAQLELDASRGDWASPIAGRTTFADYVAISYWPTTAHLEISTRTAYGYYLDKHFLPRFGTVSLRRISPAMIQTWVNDVTAGGLSPRSVVKYHALLHKIFARAVIDRAIAINPASHTALPKVVVKPKQIITAAQFDKILLQLPARYQMMVLLAIETGLRWGELIALRPCDIDMTTHVALVHRTIVEVTKKHSPTGQRIYLKDHPKDDEQRSVQIDAATCQQLQEHTRDNDIDDNGLLFTSSTGTALSRNNFRTKFWTPAVNAAKIQQNVTFHNLRAAHASWLLAGGADIIVVQERLGHRRITTTQQYTGTLPDAGDRALTAYRKIRYSETSTT